MSETMPSSDAPVHKGPPWIRPEIQKDIQWRDGDVVISVPAKSGTTWMMNIVHQLFTGGTPDFKDIYAEVPWIEFIGGPERSGQDVMNRLEAMPKDKRRAFKTHSAPPTVAYLAPGTKPDVKYIVVFRNPEEALVSFWPFLGSHTDAWYELWGMPRGLMSRPDFVSFYDEVIDANGMQGMFFGFLAAWWPLRNEKNVLFMHYNDMTRDHEATIRKVADFLGEKPSASQWSSILEYTSFPWMKKHTDKFEGHTVGTVPILKTGAMIRKGAAGKASEDGMTGEIAGHLRGIGERICPDPAALRWYYDGGRLP
jgi:hypothetical protein